MKILFIVPYPEDAAPSQRFRFEQYFKILKRSGHQYEVSPFLDAKAWAILYKPGHWFGKLSAFFRGCLRRMSDLFSMKRYDLVFIHREAAPFGPPVFEWIITRLLKKKTIYDFDDAIWIPNASESNSRLTMLFKWFSNPARICKWSTKVSAGNPYLAAYAGRFNERVYYNPTTIDTDSHHNTLKRHEHSQFVFGWTGSHSTVQYLDMLVPVLSELEQQVSFEFHVICDIPPRFNLKSLRFIPWNKETEIEDLLKFNVGLMPLPDDIWSQGKCGFKALQYMALGIPAVVSDVGVNAEIVDHNINGCVCSTGADWKHYLSKLLFEPEYLRLLSSNTRQKIVEKYSVRSNTGNFLKLIEEN